MDIIHRNANEKKEENEQKAKTVNRATTRQILPRNKYSKICVEQANETGASKWIKRKTLCNECRTALYAQHRLTRGNPPLKATITLLSDMASPEQSTSGTHQEEELVSFLFTEGHEDAIAELWEDLQGQDDDDEEEAYESVANTADQDVSSKRITSLKAIAKKLILTNTATDNTFLQEQINL
jgi:hypothetical protein